AHDPVLCDPFDLTPLRARHRLERVAEGRTGAPLHLDEGDRAGAPDDEIDLLVAQAVVPVENAPAVPHEHAAGEILAEAAEVVGARHTLEGGGRGGASP